MDKDLQTVLDRVLAAKMDLEIICMALEKWLEEHGYELPHTSTTNVIAKT